MRTFYYVHTGHRIGLDRFRRACSIIRALGDVDITLLCSDYRIASEARRFGVKNSVGIDDVRNIPNIASRGDKLIYDSAEANPFMLEDMRGFFSKFVRLSDKADDIKVDNEFLISPYLSGDGICSAVMVADEYFVETKKSINISFFFGDDDYEKDLLKNIDFIKDLNPVLGLGFYYFLDYEEELKKLFINHFEFDEYDDMITKSETFISSSPQAILEANASGAKSIYIQRADYSDDFVTLFAKYNIPIVKNYDKKLLNDILRQIDKQSYFKTEQSAQKIATFIKENLVL